MEAIQKDPSLFALMVDPFALTPGFKGPEQPRGDAVERDEDIGAEVGPFMMAAINTKNTIPETRIRCPMRGALDNMQPRRAVVTLSTSAV